MLENINVSVSVLPLETVFATKTTVGNYALNPETYAETYDLSGKGVYLFVGLVANGAFYGEPNVVYNKKTATCTVNKMQLDESDGVCFLFNKVFEKDFLVNAKSIQMGAPESLKTAFGDYQADPANYYEEYSMMGTSAYEFIGVSVNGMFYCHNSLVSFDKTTNKLTIKSLPLMNSDNIVLFYNAR